MCVCVGIFFFLIFLILLLQLHVALYMNHAHLLSLLWPRCDRLPYPAQLYNGEKITVSLTAMAESENLTDETLSQLLDLTAADMEMQQYNQQQLSNTGGNNNNYGGNDNNVPLAPPAPAIDVPSIGDDVDVAADPASNMIFSGPLMKKVNVSRFRKYVQTRMCALLRGEELGQYIWRESPPHSILSYVETVITGAYVKGLSLTVTTLTGDLNYHIVSNRAQWAALIAQHQNLFPIPRR